MNKICAVSLVILLGLSGVVLWAQEGLEWEHEHGALTQHVGTLLADADPGETWLIVKWSGRGELDQPILIEDRDHGRRESSEIRDVFGSSLILKHPLDGRYLAGARLYQNP